MLMRLWPRARTSSRVRLVRAPPCRDWLVSRLWSSSKVWSRGRFLKDCSPRTEIRTIFPAAPGHWMMSGLGGLVQRDLRADNGPQPAGLPPTDSSAAHCRCCAAAIKDHNGLLRAAAKTLYVAQVTVGNLLPSLTLFPLYHVEKPSAINYKSGAGLVSVERSMFLDTFLHALVDIGEVIKGEHPALVTRITVSHPPSAQSTF
ncbi:hypothetical protein F7725_012072 [Dissostichus mawsoni]|uniref:Uncharacterized protein n=1 Tax=Dissostichus mawsoni TaxID=36200 RepID=A0A7J5ZCJ9_DISMA|nr:hypothetical protein F7725_012072 [Dissostichus mawsoni]